MTAEAFRYEPFQPTPAPEAGTAQFYVDIEACEAAAWNAPGADKTWVERILREDRTPYPDMLRERPTASELARLVEHFDARHVQAVLIGVHGADLHARKSGKRFQTKDTDFFLPLDPANLLGAWEACTGAGFSLWSGPEPLDSPRDLELAMQVVATRSLTVAMSPTDGRVDLTLVMGSLHFEDVWLRRRVLPEESGVWVDVARLKDILRSKRDSGRTKDAAFLRKNAAILRELVDFDERRPDADRPRP